MMTENNRIDIAMAALDALRQPGPDLERLFAAMETLDGILFTGASAKVSTAIEKFGLYYNSICASFPPTAFDTKPPSLSGADTADLIARLRTVSELIRDAETERILSRLRNHKRKLPEEEIIQARRHRDWFVPLLMQACRDEIDKIKQKPELDDGLTSDEHSSVPFFALYLFSEWETAESLPIILECLSLPGKGPNDLFGDGIHEKVPSYLAQFLSHDLDRIDEMIRDPGVNVYVRWAAVSSYQYLVRDQHISVDDAIARLESNFHKTKVIGNDGRPGLEHCYELSSGIVENLYTLGGSLKSILGDDDRNWSFVDEFVFNRRDSAVPLSESERENELHRLSPTRTSDCLECLRHWAVFQERPKPKSLRTTTSSILESVKSSALPLPTINLQTLSNTAQLLSATSTMRAQERVPRNAKCPCGSGKKFKQCCMRG